MARKSSVAKKREARVRPLRVGVVGLRGIGQQHADCHMQDPLSKLVAVCDVVKERADTVAAKHKVKAY
ncbi:MAG TPA: Gfo/Idh/MocA family oxidoreductase [Candidatus Hydrogenedentes bacterium]|nr:Gfo/Idh/MocA family oxidoreductase [Candidatus Hydrogenedentota bacterium]